MSLPIQLTVFALFWLAGAAVSRLAGSVLPAGIIGLGLVLTLFALRAFEPAALRRGADWLLAQMLLFFVPALLVVLDHHELLGALGLKILLVIVLSTAAVMAVTAGVVELAHRWSTAGAAAEQAHG